MTEQYTVTGPDKLQATVALPASKSISNRALIICALSGSHEMLQNLSDCDDTRVVLHALKNRPDVVNIGAAGTAMRFMTAYLAATDSGSRLLTGSERMKHRPIKVLVEALRYLGADISYAGSKGYPPLRIRGRHLEGGTLTIDGNISSQYISALLMIGPVLSRGLTLQLRGEIISRPYIDLTLWTMREFGAQAEWTDVDTIEVKPQPYTVRPYLIENDWTSASYWYEMVALSPDPDAQVSLHGLMDGSKQGDSSVRYIFSLLGVRTIFETRQPGVPTVVRLVKSGQHLPRLEYDFVNSPDLAQTIVATCCALGVPFHFTGLQTLKIKETDRIVALKKEMAKLGYVITDNNDSELTWDGTTLPQHPATDVPVIDTYDDHRMALAFAPLSLRRPLTICHPQVVTKSYPNFWQHLQQAGFQLTPHPTPCSSSSSAS